MEFNFRKISLGTILSLSLLGIGCEEDRSPIGVQSASVETIPVDQVFRDTYGFRVYATNTNEELIETNFDANNQWSWNFGKRVVSTPMLKEFKGRPEEDAVKIFKDLKEGERGYAKTMKYQVLGSKLRREYAYTEIHLPRSSSLIPGNDSHKQGKHTTHSPM